MNPDAAAHVPLAKWVARRLRAPDPAAVAGAALLGLVKAAESHDETRGPFPPYAGLLAKQAAWEEVQRQRRNAAREVSLFVVGEAGEEVERRDLPHVEPHDGAGLMALRLRAALARLPERERRVLELRFGLAGPEETLVDVAGHMGISRVGVWKVERRAIARLHAALTSRPRRRRKSTSE